MGTLFHGLNIYLTHRVVPGNIFHGLNIYLTHRVVPGNIFHGLKMYLTHRVVRANIVPWTIYIYISYTQSSSRVSFHVEMKSFS